MNSSEKRIQMQIPGNIGGGESEVTEKIHQTDWQMKQIDG